MEARRQERQRRESAKSSAVNVLPSLQDRDFHVRLIELYGKKPCLWNTNLKEHQDAELKRKAWDDISNKLGSHLTASFVRSRISCMRYRLNVYKLQMLEYKMSPSSGKKPDKPFYVDKFDFLDTLTNNSKKEEVQPQLSKSEQLNKDLEEKERQSIASIFKRRLQQQEKHPLVLHHLSAMKDGMEQGSAFSDLNIASVVKKRFQQQTLFTPQNNLPKFRESFSNARRLILEAGKQIQPVDDKFKLMKESKPNNLELKQRMNRLKRVEQVPDPSTDVLDSSSDFRASQLNIPSVVRKRMQQQFPRGTLRGLDPEKSSSKTFPNFTDSIPRRALPGDSVSKTKMPKPKKIVLEESKEHSDDDDLYRLHWNVRKQHRTRRSAVMGTSLDFRQDSVPPLLLGPRSRTESNVFKALGSNT